MAHQDSLGERARGEKRFPHSLDSHIHNEKSRGLLCSTTFSFQPKLTYTSFCS